MRLFIAVEAPEETNNHFLELQKQIDTNLAKITFTKSFHLTLKFIGDADEAKKDKIAGLLDNIQFEPFSVNLSDIGVFPDENYIRVVWVGLEPKDSIIKLQQKIDSALINLFPNDKRFHPHITLGRVKFVRDKGEFLKSLKRIKVERKSFEVNELKLVKSTLTPKGPVYDTLYVFKTVK